MTWSTAHHPVLQCCSSLQFVAVWFSLNSLEVFVGPVSADDLWYGTPPCVAVFSDLQFDAVWCSMDSLGVCFGACQCWWLEVWHTTLWCRCVAGVLQVCCNVLQCREIWRTPNETRIKLKSKRKEREIQRERGETLKRKTKILGFYFWRCKCACHQYSSLLPFPPRGGMSHIYTYIYTYI